MSACRDPVEAVPTVLSYTYIYTCTRCAVDRRLTRPDWALISLVVFVVSRTDPVCVLVSLCLYTGASVAPRRPAGQPLLREIIQFSQFLQGQCVGDASAAAREIVSSVAGWRV